MKDGDDLMNQSLDRARRRRFTIAAAIVAAILMAAACSSSNDGGSASTADTIEAHASQSVQGPTDQVSAILVQPVNDAQVVRGDDDMDHVEYELLVVNLFSDPVTLSNVTVLDPDGQELMQIDGEVLAAATQSLFTKEPSPVIGVSAAVSVDVDLVLAPDTVPERVTHRIDYALPADSAGAVILDDPVVHGPEVAIDRRGAIVISSPLAGDGWLATSACCAPNVHRDLRLAIDGRRISTAETFAVDWARVENDRLFDGDGSQNEQFYAFGSEVLAVADGTVVSINDGVPESTPYVSKAPETKAGFGGNQVILEIAPGVYAAYAHLQPGSLTVKVGDTVKAGAVLAKLGNTGPSEGPHLHFGLLDKPDLFAGRSLPFVLDRFTLGGTVDFETSEADNLVISPESREVREAYPLYGSIQNFS